MVLTLLLRSHSDMQQLEEADKAGHAENRVAICAIYQRGIGDFRRQTFAEKNTMQYHTLICNRRNPNSDPAGQIHKPSICVSICWSEESFSSAPERVMHRMFSCRMHGASASRLGMHDNTQPDRGICVLSHCGSVRESTVSNWID